jgi:hypothetical protein
VPVKGNVTLLDPRPLKEAAAAHGLLYLEADDVAINLSIGFIILRITPTKNAAAAESQARTALF